MSPRRNYPKKKRPTSQDRDIATSNQTFEEHHEGLYIVRKITGSSSSKPYRCPGCDQIIPMATPHTVAWMEDDEQGRRHWHNACWAKKNNRRPNTERTRNAPRY
ncbi:MAG: hypothetical protein F2814_02755 [Actinobacteria bacterium]|nr:hypothetical protein [Actinomycetota bacterium]